MPNGKSLYNVYAVASASEGKLQAAETRVLNIGKLLGGKLQSMDWDQSQTQKGIGALSEALSISSTLYGGYEAKQEFESAKTGVQSQIAKESYTGEDYESFIGTTEGQKYLESFAPEKSWSLKEGTKYKFGEGENRYSLGKGAISGIGTGAKYGVKADLSMYKEVSQDPPSAPSSPAAPSGKFYGEKKGLDLGDVIGEKSIFAAGKQKLSSILSKEPKSGEGTVSKPDYDTEGMSPTTKKMYDQQMGFNQETELKTQETETSIYGSKENPFRAKGVGDVFKLAKAAGMKAEGQTLYSQWGEGPMKSWAYSYGK